MNALRSFGRGLAHRQGVTLNLVLTAVAVLQVAAVALALGGCNGTSVPAAIAVGTTDSAKAAAALSTTAQTVATVNTAIPANIKTAIISLIARHPEVKADLETVANAIESAASQGAVITNDAALVNTYLPWLAALPGVGSFVTDLHGVLSAAIAVEPLTAQALTEIGELIKSYA